MQLFASVALLLIGAATAANDVRKPWGTMPIPAAVLPTSFPPPSHENAGVIEAIRNTLALYPFAIDGKNFAALSNVFADDAVANYSAPLNVLTPLSTIESVLAASTACVTTQHQFGTQLIDVVAPTVAHSVTYYTASHFGTGNQTGQVAYAYGQYQDTWNRQKDGSWRIVHRNLVYMCPIIGNQAVFVC